jgi:rubrerythrin
MPEGSGQNVEAGSADFVEFGAAGEAGTGEYHCSACGYGVVVQRSLPRCPMCSGTVWEPGPRHGVEGQHTAMRLQ